MSKAFRVLAGSVTLLLAVALASCAGGTVVTVNGQQISRAQLDTKLEGSPIARQMLQQMVQETLIDQYAEQHHVNVSDAAIAQRENELKSNYPGDAWSQMLEARGLTEKDVHDALKIQLILDAALQPNVHITNAQVADYFNKNHAAFDTPAQACASHILVPSLTLANQVEAKLKGGANFGQLAQQYSIDPGSKTKGGSLGCFPRGRMVPAFDQAAFSQPIGKVGAPVRSPFGYHIILVTSRQPGQSATLASARSRILLQLQQQQEAPLVQPFIANLEQQAHIVSNDQQFAGLFPSPPPMPAPAPATAAPARPAATPAHH